MEKSFSSKVKDELSELDLKNSNSCVAELSAILIFGENTGIDNNIVIKNDRAQTLARIQALFKRTLNEAPSIDVRNSRRGYSISVAPDAVEELGVFFSENGDIELDEDIFADEESKRAFLRGAFIISGTVNSPQKDYSCELFTSNENMALLASEILTSFGVHANTIKRKGYYVTYLKDKNSVSDFLNIIGAHNCMMELMMTQIEKDMRNRMNRQINCKTANIDKTIKASVRQCEAIEKIMKRPVWETLDEQIKQLALLRLENVELGLSQLGALLTPPMNKSSVNRKMNKLISLAEEA